MTFTEKAGMAQEIVADAPSLAKIIHNTGKAALYGIYFDTDKSEVKPESEPNLKEIAKMVKENPQLKLLVVGHTDNVGKFESNIELSHKRAEAVIKVLVSKYGVGQNRLMGFGMVSPVASNKTEEGRAQNRRVELVEY